MDKNKQHNAAREVHHTESSTMHSMHKPNTPEGFFNPADKQTPASKKPWYRNHRNQIIVGISATIIIAASLGGWYVLTHKKKVVAEAPKPTETPRPSESPKPITKAAPLTGLQVDPAQADLPIVGVVVENLYPDARPQSGLSQAGIVYEALAEGGITRYQAFYQELPKDIGPVRSLRTYFAYWGLEYNSPVAHAGGNADALDLAAAQKMKDLNAFYYLDFRRISSRYAPHNLYITGESLGKLAKAQGFDEKPTVEAWPYKDDAKSPTPTASKITVDFSYYDYQASFAYNPDSNDYTRSVRGVPAIDQNTEKAAQPKNVIVMYMPTSYGKTRTDEQTVIMQIIGSGKAVVFRDGVATEGTWKKESAGGRTTFTDTAGAPISLNRGQTWVSVVPVGKLATWE
ncbi:MAG: DUF3048 domain-containing protein [bacterium]